MESETVANDISLTPADLARLEINALCSSPEFRPTFVVGGTTPPEMLDENRRRAEALRICIFEVMAEYGVVHEYLRTLIEREVQLTEELEQVQRDIVYLKKLRTPGDTRIPLLQFFSLERLHEHAKSPSQAARTYNSLKSLLECADTERKRLDLATGPVDTIGEFIENCTSDSLRRIRGFGKGCLSLVQALLRDAGLSLKE